MSDPPVCDDAAAVKGGLLVLEATDRTQVGRFHKAGVRERVAITAFLRRRG